MIRKSAEKSMRRQSHANRESKKANYMATVISAHTEINNSPKLNQQIQSVFVSIPLEKWSCVRPRVLDAIRMPLRFLWVHLITTGYVLWSAQLHANINWLRWLFFAKPMTDANLLPCYSAFSPASCSVLIEASRAEPKNNWQRVRLRLNFRAK